MFGGAKFLATLEEEFVRSFESLVAVFEVQTWYRGFIISGDFEKNIIKIDA